MGNGLRSFKGRGASNFGGQLGRRMAGGEVPAGGHGGRLFCSKNQKKEGREVEGESKRAKEGMLALVCGLNRRRRRARARHRRQRWRQSREKTERKKKGNFPKDLCTNSENTGTSL
jgi:hypothetical protein